MNTTRKYIVTGFEPTATEPTTKEYNLQELLVDDGFELTYTLQDELDDILDMPIGRCKYITMTRACNESLGVIKRIS